MPKNSIWEQVMTMSTWTTLEIMQFVGCCVSPQKSLMLHQLNTFIKDKGIAVYHGQISDADLTNLCNELVFAIESCIGPSDINLQEEITLTFLVKTLPRIIEIFLKRNTLRYIIFLFCCSHVSQTAWKFHSKCAVGVITPSRSASLSRDSTTVWIEKSHSHCKP